MDQELKTSIFKLYLFAFSAGGLFFFGIEQFFLQTFADGDFARGVLLAVFSATFALTNLPTGALSDVWGRVNALRLASLILVVALIILGFSNSLLIYAIGSVLFAIFWALWDGAAEAFLYDKMADHGYEKNFEKYQGRVTAALLIGASIANFFSGFMAEATSLRFTYFASLVPALVAFMVALSMVEPEHHRSVGSSIRKQLSGVAHEVRRVSALRYLILGGAFIFVLSLISGEFTQPVVVRFTDSPRVLGVVWMVVTLIMALGAGLSHRLKSQRSLLVLLACSAGVYLAFSDRFIGVAGLIMIIALSEAAANKNVADIQKMLPSKLRASAGSVTTTLSNMMVPFVAVFVGVGASTNIRLYLGGTLAGLILAATVVLMLAGLQKVGDTNRSVL